jgi:peptide/nickel transport system substrate-binding protein
LARFPAPDYQFHQIGSGPYRFVDYVPTDRLSLSANPEYAWAPPVYRRDKPAVSAFEFGFYEDPATRALALEQGEVHVVGEVPPHDAERLIADGGFRLVPVAIPGMPMQFFFNTRAGPTADPVVRMALIHAVDRQEVVQIVFSGMSPVAVAPLTADMLEPAYQSTLPRFDPQASGELLEEAGWIESGGSRAKDGEALRLRVVVPNWGSHPDVAQLLDLAWEAAGAQVEVTVTAGFGPLQESAASGQYEVIAFNSFGTDPDLLSSFYSSGGLFNWSGVQDEELDRLLSQARATLAPGVRAGMYSRIAHRIDELALGFPIRDYVNLVVADRRLEGLRFSPQGWFPYLIEVSLGP